MIYTKKIFYFFLMIPILLLFLFIPKKADAWTGTLPTPLLCNGMSMADTLSTVADAPNYHYFDNGGKLSTCDETNKKITMYSLQDLGKSFIFSTDANGNHYFRAETGTRATIDIYNAKNPYDIVSTSSVITTVYDIPNFHDWANLKYDSNYTGQILSGMTLVQAPAPAPAPEPIPPPQDITPRDAKLIAIFVMFYISSQFLKYFRYRG